MSWDNFDLDAWHMTRALELAGRGRGAVEPNPLVGCIIAQGAESVGEGWHRQFGGPHAEVDALAIAGDRAAGGTMYVTLEPCCHHGKTPPCTAAIVSARIARVVVAQRDPFPAVAGGGIDALQAAGIAVDVGVLEAAARSLNAPYLKLLATGRPWLIGKWAMTLDGKIATRTGDSRWISSEASRAVAHRLRGQVDAILVGRGTALTDDPLLTARPAGPRIATRIVLDRQASLPSGSQLVRTARDVPVIVACGLAAPATEQARLKATGCEVLSLAGADDQEQFCTLLDELGRRRMTNVLVEGGSRLLGTCLDTGQLDEVHVFIASKLVGGATAPTPLPGQGIERIAAALALADVRIEMLGTDVYVRGRISRTPSGV